MLTDHFQGLALIVNRLEAEEKIRFVEIFDQHVVRSDRPGELNPVDQFFVVRHLEFEVLTKRFKVHRFGGFTSNPDVISQAVDSTGVIANPCQQEALIVERLA